MVVVAVVVTVVLSVAVLLALIRIALGPSVLDRVVAVDTLLAISMAAVGTEAALHRNATTLPILVVLAILGFVGSVSVVRIMVRHRP